MRLVDFTDEQGLEAVYKRMIERPKRKCGLVPELHSLSCDRRRWLMGKLTLSYDHGDILNKTFIPRDPSKKTGFSVRRILKLFESTITGVVVISVVARYCRVLLNSW